MIERYILPEMGKIWSDDNRYQQMLQVEIYACEAMKDLGKITPEQYEEIARDAAFDINRISELNKTMKHDLVAFVTSVNEHLTPEGARILHRGLTASDVLDTALAVQMTQSVEILLGKMYDLLDTIKKKALQYKFSLMIGRTHGIHAEPLTFGLKMALWYEDMYRCIEHMHQAKAMISVGMISGSVGTFASTDPLIEEHVCRRLNLKPALVTTQIIQRDRLAFFIDMIALTGSVLDKFATELRNLQRSEIAEVMESFNHGQAGSSAMPHKMNPVLSERISGLARVLRGYSVTAMENIVLWHERDLSHSSVERIIVPDSCILLDQMLYLMNNVLSDLHVNEENMVRNIENDHGVIFSQRLFLTLLDKGIARNTAYKWSKRNAKKCIEDGVDFEYLVLQDEDIMNVITKEEIYDIFNYDYFVKNINYIFNRVGIELPE